MDRLDTRFPSARTFPDFGPLFTALFSAFLNAFPVCLAIKEWRLTPRVLEEDNNVEGGVQAVNALLTEKCRPTAVLCSNDLTAMSIIRSFCRSVTPGRCDPRWVTLAESDSALHKRLPNAFTPFTESQNYKCALHELV